jgi:hypothetical protein
MSKDPIRGKTIRFTFHDGPMAKKTYEHVFEDDGSVRFYEVGGDVKRADAHVHAQEPKNAPHRYEAVRIRADVWAVSYLSAAGYTLITVLDFESHKLVAFSSNEKLLAVQHGTFEEVSRPGARGHAAHQARHSSS